jgi:hypothetical protein
LVATFAVFLADPLDAPFDGDESFEDAAGAGATGFGAFAGDFAGGAALVPAAFAGSFDLGDGDFDAGLAGAFSGAFVEAFGAGCLAGAFPGDLPSGDLPAPFAAGAAAAFGDGEACRAEGRDGFAVLATGGALDRGRGAGERRSERTNSPPAGDVGAAGAAETTRNPRILQAKGGSRPNAATRLEPRLSFPAGD